jgi:4a-hydroxytetrahydrobiopterin dehydratase
MTVEELAKKECLPCKGDVPPLKGHDLTILHDELGPAWDLVEEHHLTRAYSFKGYTPAVTFTNTVAGIAEQQMHHPDILLTWGKVEVTIWTHKIDGLTKSDFVFAAKVEEAYNAQEE